MTADQWARVLEQAARDLPAAVERAVSSTLELAKTTAESHSHGTISLQEMRRKALDHPFAIRHGAPRADASIINDQGGAFAGAWTISAPVVTGDHVRGAVYNASPEAQYLDTPDGYTRKIMFARPVNERVGHEIAEQFAETLVQELGSIQPR